MDGLGIAFACISIDMQFIVQAGLAKICRLGSKLVHCFSLTTRVLEVYCQAFRDLQWHAIPLLSFGARPRRRQTSASTETTRKNRKDQKENNH